MDAEPLAVVKRGRTVFAVYAFEASTLLGGRPRSRTGTDTRYAVRAMAVGGPRKVSPEDAVRRTRRGEGTPLGDFATLAQASAWVAAYSPRYGLVTRKG